MVSGIMSGVMSSHTGFRLKIMQAPFQFQIFEALQSASQLCPVSIVANLILLKVHGYFLGI